MIESAHNRLIKDIKALADKKNRDREGLFIADGARFVSEIPENVKIVKMIFSESNAEKNDIDGYFKKAECAVISDRLFSSLSDTKNPQGIMAVCKKMKSDIKNIIKKKKNLKKK